MIRPGREVFRHGEESGNVSSTAYALPTPELVLDRYRPLRPIGRGGSGSVWLARDERTGLEVALKIVPREGKRASRAAREMEAASRLRHDRCVRAYDFGGDSGHVYIAYEYVQGQTMREALRAGKLERPRRRRGGGPDPRRTRARPPHRDRPSRREAVERPRRGGRRRCRSGSSTSASRSSTRPTRSRPSATSPARSPTSRPSDSAERTRRPRATSGRSASCSGSRSPASTRSGVFRCRRSPRRSRRERRRSGRVRSDLPPALADAVSSALAVDPATAPVGRAARPRSARCRHVASPRSDDPGAPAQDSPDPEVGSRSAPARAAARSRGARCSRCRDRSDAASVLATRPACSCSRSRLRSRCCAPRASGSRSRSSSPCSRSATSRRQPPSRTRRSPSSGSRSAGVTRAPGFSSSQARSWRRSGYRSPPARGTTRTRARAPRAARVRRRARSRRCRGPPEGTLPLTGDAISNLGVDGSTSLTDVVGAGRRPSPGESLVSSPSRLVLAAAAALAPGRADARLPRYRRPRGLPDRPHPVPRSDASGASDRARHTRPLRDPRGPYAPGRSLPLAARRPLRP